MQGKACVYAATIIAGFLNAYIKHPMVLGKCMGSVELLERTRDGVHREIHDFTAFHKKETECCKYCYKKTIFASPKNTSRQY